MKVYLESIGCRLNQSEVEHMAGLLFAAGWQIVANLHEADAVIINTCAVTANAVADSRQIVRKAASAGKTVYATGCWATLATGHVEQLGSGITAVTNEDKDRLVPDYLLEEEMLQVVEADGRYQLPGRQSRTRAFIKTQDGCDNACTYCITRIARGKAISVPQEQVIADVLRAAQQGVKEVVLTGVNLGSWGKGMPAGQSLKTLIAAILNETDIPRVRLSSLEPWDLTEDFFHLWESPRMCRHLHLSLQSGSDRVLRAMARKNTTASFTALAAAARQVVPDMAITTDIIAGFPGETQADFEHSLAFINGLPFSGGHVFSYSPRLGTAASIMADQVPAAIKKARAAVLRQAFETLASAYAGRFIGRQLHVLWEKVQPDAGSWRMSGLSDNYLRIDANAPASLTNQISRVLITGQQAGSLIGAIITGGSPSDERDLQ